MKARQAKRLARTVSTISLLVVIGAGFSSISSASEKGADQGDVRSKYVQVVVTPGESLWSIAKLLGGDQEENVARILELNALTTPNLSAGTRLIIPTRE